jgi:hypothetical protein
MKPPKVYEETIPNSHRIINRTKIVQSIEHLQIIRAGSFQTAHECYSRINALIFVVSFPAARSAPNVKWWFVAVTNSNRGKAAVSATLHSDRTIKNMASPWPGTLSADPRMFCRATNTSKWFVSATAGPKELNRRVISAAWRRWASASRASSSDNAMQGRCDIKVDGVLGLA